MACDVPTLQPWDLKFGPKHDVRSYGHILLLLASQGKIAAAHFAVPCQSLTWARAPQLRSTEFPFGRSNLLGHQAELVATGNSLLEFTADMCILLWQQDCYFSVENPELSWLWLLDPFVKLRALKGVELVKIFYSDFGVPFSKPTLFLHNLPTLHMLDQTVYEWPSPTIPLRGVVEWEGRRVFRTRLAQTYPPLLGCRFAHLLKKALAARELALHTSSPVPMAVHHSDLPHLLQQVERAMVQTAQSGPRFVPWGAGAIEGLTPVQHVYFAIKVQHPACEAIVMEPDLEEAITFELSLSSSEIDAFRQNLLQRFLIIAAELEPVQHTWATQAPANLQQLVARIHGPLWQLLCHELHVDGSLFLPALQQGFPLVGCLPPCEGYATASCSIPLLSVEELRTGREVFNDRVLQSLVELPHSCDILEQTLEDSESGFMSSPRLLVPGDLANKSLTRRIPVREERSTGWRTRIVDHETESGVNTATAPVDKIHHDSIDSLVSILQKFMMHGTTAEMWKRDISKAFRRVPVAAEHHEFAWTVWKSHGQLWISQHFGMPFGTVSAVYAWHRVGHMMWLILVRLFKAPACRYVDDYFGASKTGVVFSAAKVLTIMSRLLGFPTDHAKDDDATWNLVVLGALVSVSWAEQKVFTRVNPDKAKKYQAVLQQMLDSNVLTAGDASKMAGRLSFSVTVSGNRAGRAYIKPFYAQAHEPLPQSSLSPWLRRAGQWFMQYLECCPTSIRTCPDAARTQVVTWSDAAGESKWVAAVIWHNQQFLFTRMQTPAQLWKLLLDRGDHQIQFQEVLGLLLAWGTFCPLLKGAAWLAFVDNNTVLHALLTGGGGGPESHMCVGRLWLELAKSGVALHVGRVESSANIADGPTRNDLATLALLKAQWVPPLLPEWVADFWSGPAV